MCDSIYLKALALGPVDFPRPKYCCSCSRHSVMRRSCFISQGDLFWTAFAPFVSAINDGLSLTTLEINLHIWVFR